MFTVDQAYRINRNRMLLLRSTLATGDASAAHGIEGIDVLEINCECSAEHCTATLMVRRGEYEPLRPGRRQLLVAAGHEIDSPVQVTRRTETYEIVEPWWP